MVINLYQRGKNNVNITQFEKRSVKMDKKVNRIIGNHVKRILLGKNMSQTQLAKAVQMPLSTINDYIMGKSRMSYKNMARIATYLEIDIHKLKSISLLKEMVVEHGLERMVSLYQEMLLEESDITVHMLQDKDLYYHFVVLPKETYQSSDIVCVYKRLERTYGLVRYQNVANTERILGLVMDIIVA